MDKLQNYRIIESPYECGYRHIVPPEGIFSWTGHKAYCFHAGNKNNSCESPQDFGWYTEKGNYFPETCPLKKILNNKT